MNRRIFKQSSAIFWLAFAALVLRASVGEGFMLGASGDGGLTVVVCGGLSASGHEHHYSSDHLAAGHAAHDHSPCPYAVGGALGAAGAQILHLASVATMDRVAMPPSVIVPDRSHVASYLSRGPPALI